ncbi:MAG: amino acid permease [Flammeovirgaceae bacterium]|nr:amino acid permease [Flammeovirgaceae bacterium]
MAGSLVKRQGFGTAPVFLTSICTILGAILFLRFGFAVGNLGLWQTFMIILLGHLVTIPTALAVAEIATNQKVQGGGVYFIISRSFGITIGGAIGIGLYLSQAVSTAFYIIAFAESFSPIFNYLLASDFNILVYNYRVISIPATIVLILLAIYKGADLGIKTLYLVAFVLFFSLLFFFLGTTEYAQNMESIPWDAKILNGKSFFYFFAVCFPAFTGMAAGAGLSGDLKNPSKSIPRGTIWATIAGMIIYMVTALKLAISAPPGDLAADQFIMQDIALWGPAIPIGLAAASLSSAIGSILVAPRTLQAIGADKILPNSFVNDWVSQVRLKSNEPVNASIITSVITLIFVIIGDIDIVAQIITMFFMVTYGAICSISFLEHFTADPAYRPIFRSKWYVSLVGALACIFLMFQISVFYSIMALIIMAIIYQTTSYYKEDKEGLANIFQGVIFQLSRRLKVFLQKADPDSKEDHWRPSVVCISSNTFERFSAFNMLRWISHKYGFGNYIHLIEGYLSRETYKEAKECVNRMVKLSDSTKSRVYMDTIVSPSITSAIAQVIQLPGVSGKDNNMIMFEFSKKKPEGLENIVDNFKLVKSTDFDICVLGSSEKNFGFKQNIDIWITSKDYENASLMILMGFIILGHPEWKNARIRLMVLSPEKELEKQRNKIRELIRTGRLPISLNNVELNEHKDNIEAKSIINEKSKDADLVIIGVRTEAIKHDSIGIFNGYEGVGDVLFVNTNKEKEIK